jgi:hypothetical protein
MSSCALAHGCCWIAPRSRSPQATKSVLSVATAPGRPLLPEYWRGRGRPRPARSLPAARSATCRRTPGSAISRRWRWTGSCPLAAWTRCWPGCARPNCRWPIPIRAGVMPASGGTGCWKSASPCSVATRPSRKPPRWPTAAPDRAGQDPVRRLGHTAAGRADQPPGCRLGQLAARPPAHLPRWPGRHQPRHEPAGGRGQQGVPSRC